MTTRQRRKRIVIRKRRPPLGPLDLPPSEDAAVGALLGAVEATVDRVMRDAGAPLPRVTPRDVLEGRARSQSFYDADTERLPRAELARPDSLAPFVVRRPPMMPPPDAALPARPRARPGGPPSLPWMLLLLTLGALASFAGAMSAREAPRAAPASAPTEVSDASTD